MVVYYFNKNVALIDIKLCVLAHPSEQSEIRNLSNFMLQGERFFLLFSELMFSYFSLGTRLL